MNFKDWFSSGAFYDTIVDADIRNKKSLYTLFAKYLDHIPNQILSFWTKNG